MRKTIHELGLVWVCRSTILLLAHRQSKNEEEQKKASIGHFARPGTRIGVIKRSTFYKAALCKLSFVL